MNCWLWYCYRQDIVKLWAVILDYIWKTLSISCCCINDTISHLIYVHLLIQLKIHFTWASAFTRTLYSKKVILCLKYHKSYIFLQSVAQFSSAFFLDTEGLWVFIQKNKHLQRFNSWKYLSIGCSHSDRPKTKTIPPEMNGAYFLSFILEMAKWCHVRKHFYRHQLWLSILSEFTDTTSFNIITSQNPLSLGCSQDANMVLG